MVVVANDKGYEPMLEHARAMGFAVRRLAHGKPKAAAKKAVTKKVAGKKAPPKKVVAKKAAAKTPAARQPIAKKAAAKKTTAAPVAKKAPVKKAAPAKTAVPAKEVEARAPVPSASTPVAVAPADAKGTVAKPAALVPDSAATIKKLTDSLRKMGDKRPTKPASLRRLLKSFLGIGATVEAVGVALDRLIVDGVVEVDPVKGASYPGFASADRSAVSQV